MNLYVINKVIQDIMDEHIDYDTGEITPEGAEKLASLGVEKEMIIDELLKSYKNHQILIDGINAEINRLKERVAKLQSTQQSILKQVRPYLTEGEKRETAEYELKWTTSTTVDGLDVYDPELIFNDPDDPLFEYVVKKVPDPTYRFDKRAIQKELKKEGNNLPIDLYINQTKNPKIN